MSTFDMKTMVLFASTRLDTGTSVLATFDSFWKQAHFGQLGKTRFYCLDMSGSWWKFGEIVWAIV